MVFTVLEHLTRLRYGPAFFSKTHIVQTFWINHCTLIHIGFMACYITSEESVYVAPITTLTNIFSNINILLVTFPSLMVCMTVEKTVISTGGKGLKL